MNKLIYLIILVTACSSPSQDLKTDRQDNSNKVESKSDSPLQSINPDYLPLTAQATFSDVMSAVIEFEGQIRKSNFESYGDSITLDDFLIAIDYSRERYDKLHAKVIELGQNSSVDPKKKREYSDKLLPRLGNNFAQEANPKIAVNFLNSIRNNKLPVFNPQSPNRYVATSGCGTGLDNLLVSSIFPSAVATCDFWSGACGWEATACTIVAAGASGGCYVFAPVCFLAGGALCYCEFCTGCFRDEFCSTE